MRFVTRILKCHDLGSKGLIFCISNTPCDASEHPKREIKCALHGTATGIAVYAMVNGFNLTPFTGRRSRTQWEPTKYCQTTEREF